MSEQNNIVTFGKPYEFEGAELTEIDLSGIENLTGEDLMEADKVYSSSGQFSPVPEVTLGYTLVIAAKVTSKPVEFFNKLPAKEAIKVKNAVIAFLNN